MTAKDKAKELVFKFETLMIIDASSPWDRPTLDMKKCALICVDEILEFYDRIDVKYWKEVKQEINKL
tara:strand:- start:1423 stop:1623 length:201 start_codon:yes stop_codon:yes gene_type:complete